MSRSKPKTRARKARLDRGLLNALSKNYSRGAIVVIGANDLVGRAIREGQRTLTPDGEPSLWSHCFLFGERRLTYSGAGRHPKPSPYIFESDLHVTLPRTEVRNGAQENWVGKWCESRVEHCAVIDLGLSDRAAGIVLATALNLVDRQVNYPLQELVGTWLAIVRSKLWRANPLKSSNAMQCSTFVRYCYRRAGRDFMPRNISLSNTAPEHVARAADEQGYLHYIR